MSPSARPGPGFRPRDEARPNRVELDVAKAGVEMPLVHRKRAEAALPEMSAPAVAAVDLDRVARVRRRQRGPQAVLMGGDQDEVDVVRHQAPGPDPGSAPGAEMAEQGQVASVVAVREEDALAAIAALGDVMGQSRQDGAGGSRHGGQTNRKTQFTPAVPCK